MNNNNQTTQSAKQTSPNSKVVGFSAPKGATQFCRPSVSNYNSQQTVLVKCENNLCVGYEKVPINELEFKWKGAKIPFELWMEIMAFHRYSSKKHNGHEIQGRFFYNTETQEWANVVYPQHGQGLSTTEDTTGEAINEIFRQYPHPWRSIGTHHNHCNVGASQSGTDYKDEINQPGFHITLGTINQTTMDIDVRFTVFGFNHKNLNILDWVDITEDTRNHAVWKDAIERLRLKDKFIETAKKAMFTCPSAWDDLSHVEWFDYMVSEGWDMSKFDESILLSLHPNLDDYEEKIKLWDSLITTGSRSTFARKQRDQSKALPAHYKPKGYSYTPSRNARLNIYDKDKGRGTAADTVKTTALHPQMLNEYLATHEEKLALQAVWPVLVKCNYDFGLLQYLSSLPEQSAKLLLSDERSLYDHLQRVANSANCPYNQVSDFVPLFESIALVGDVGEIELPEQTSKSVQT